MNNQEIFSNSFFAMGTRCDVVFTAVEQQFAEQIFQVVKNEIANLEQRLSRFIPESPVSQLNNAEAGIWISVPDDIWDILTISYDFYQMSNGAFDITAAPLISLWKKSKNPSEIEIENAIRISGFDKVELNFEDQKIKFSVDGVEFDFGAIGKGIALDTLKPILQKQGIENGIVSFGESSILALGMHPNGEKWPLGIRNNFDPKDYVHVFSTSNETITTSGTLINTDEGEVVQRNHIISPATGHPVSIDKTVSVKSESATMGEFLSTTFLILPENDRLILSEKLKNIEILEVNYLEKNDCNTKLTIL